KDSAASLLVSYALPERIKKALGPTIDELVTALPSKAPDETHKKLFAKLLNALAPSLKAGEIDAAVDFRGPSAKQHHTLVAGLKHALTAQPGTAGMVRLDVAAARWVPLMAHDQPAAPKAAKEAFGKTPNDDRVQLSISGGTALKAEFHIQAGILKFYNILK